MSKAFDTVKRPTLLAVQAANKLKYILDSKKLGTEIKIRTLNAYIASIFLYKGIRYMDPFLPCGNMW